MQDLKIRLKYNAIVNILLAILFCSFTIFSTYIWGRYVMFLCMLFIIIIDCLKNKFKYKIAGDFVIWWMLFFILYILINSIWAENMSDTLEKVRTMIELMALFFVLYNHYRNCENNVSDIIQVIKWSSFFIVLYSLFFYDIKQLVIMMENGTRMDNSFANVNIIGMIASVGVLIQLDEIIKKRKLKIGIIFCVPSIFLIAATYSRKALVMLVAGIVLILFIRICAEHNMIKRVVWVLISVFFFSIIMYLLFSHPLFNGMMKRMERLVNSFLGNGKMDSSTLIRNSMIQLGWKEFLKSPLVGIGVGNSHLFASKYLNFDAYLHNNFIELLSGGGIIGFGIYYYIYAYLIAKFWKYRHQKSEEYDICIVLMVLFLAMDYGRVSYYSKITYVFLLLYCLEINKYKES